MMPEEQAENRTGRFKPGKSGNPGGRPKGSVSLTAILRRKLAESDQKEAEAIVDALIKGAAAGDARHIKEILDRIDGKVPDKLEHEGDLTIRVEYADADPDGDTAAPASGAAADPEGDATV